MCCEVNQIQLPSSRQQQQSSYTLQKAWLYVVGQFLIVKWFCLNYFQERRHLSHSPHLYVGYCCCIIRVFMQLSLFGFLIFQLYVPGRLAQTDSVLLDIGTGYFTEKVGSCLLRITFHSSQRNNVQTVEEAKSYFQRKVEYLSKQVEEVQPTLVDKQKMRDGKLLIYLGGSCREIDAPPFIQWC